MFRTKSPITNKLTFEEKHAYEKAGFLVLSPAGETQDFIFGPADDDMRCGGVYFGMSLDAHKYEGREHFSGGIVGLEDCIQLRDHLEKHIQQMTKRSDKVAA